MFFKRKQIIASLILSLFFNFNIFNNFNDNYKITFIGDEIQKAYEETPDVIVNGIKLDDDYIGYTYADLAIYSLPFTETSSPSSEGGPYREACWISRISSFQHRISNSSPIQTNRPTSLFHQSDEIE